MIACQLAKFDDMILSNNDGSVGDVITKTSSTTTEWKPTTYIAQINSTRVWDVNSGENVLKTGSLFSVNDPFTFDPITGLLTCVEEGYYFCSYRNRFTSYTAQSSLTLGDGSSTYSVAVTTFIVGNNQDQDFNVSFTNFFSVGGVYDFRFVPHVNPGTLTTTGADPTYGNPTNVLTLFKI